MPSKEELIQEITQFLGRTPAETRLLLKTLAHPDLIDYTKAYFGGLDKRSMCTKYESPWTCAKEAQSRFETIHDGWLGGIGIDISWCENCRDKVMRSE